MKSLIVCHPNCSVCTNTADYIVVCQFFIIIALRLKLMHQKWPAADNFCHHTADQANHVNFDVDLKWGCGCS